MKTVFDAAQVIHIWANKSQPTARTSSGNVFFNSGLTGDEAATLYSYGTHYPMGHHLNGVTLINSESNSVTTNKHMGWVRDAVRHLNTIFVPTDIIKHVIANAHHDLAWFNGDKKAFKGAQARLADKVAEWVSGELVQAAKRAASRRKPELVARDIDDGLHSYGQGENLLEYFGLKMPAKAAALADTLRNDAAAVVAQNAKAIALAKEKARREAAKRLKQQIADAHEVLPAWLRGEDTSYLTREKLRYLPDIWLQVVGDDVVTSHGAVFPVEHARKAFPFIRAVKERGAEYGATIRLGHFTVDSITANGDVKAGCHFVKWAAIEHAARILNIFP